MQVRSSCAAHPWGLPSRWQGVCGRLHFFGVRGRGPWWEWGLDSLCGVRISPAGLWPLPGGPSSLPNKREMARMKAFGLNVKVAPESPRVTGGDGTAATAAGEAGSDATLATGGPRPNDTAKAGVPPSFTIEVKGLLEWR